MGELKVTYKKAHVVEQIHLKKVRGHYKIQAEVSVTQYQDKETNQFVIYVPSLDISGYGETIEKAQKIIEFSLNEFCEYLSSLSVKKIETELFKLGWKHDKLKNKEYSKAYIDMSGKLKNFAIEDTLKVSVLTAA